MDRRNGSGFVIYSMYDSYDTWYYSMRYSIEKQWIHLKMYSGRPMLYEYYATDRPMTN